MLKTESKKKEKTPFDILLQKHIRQIKKLIYENNPQTTKKQSTNSENKQVFKILRNRTIPLIPTIKSTKKKKTPYDILLQQHIRETKKIINQNNPTPKKKEKKEKEVY